jgi:hypothetical protein
MSVAKAVVKAGAAGPWHPSRKVEVVAAFPTFGIQPAETLP